MVELKDALATFFLHLEGAVTRTRIVNVTVAIVVITLTLELDVPGRSIVGTAHTHEYKRVVVHRREHERHCTLAAALTVSGSHAFAAVVHVNADAAGACRPREADVATYGTQINVELGDATTRPCSGVWTLERAIETARACSTAIRIRTNDWWDFGFADFQTRTIDAVTLITSTVPITVRQIKAWRIRSVWLVTTTAVTRTSVTVIEHRAFRTVVDAAAWTCTAASTTTSVSAACATTCAATTATTATTATCATTAAFGNAGTRTVLTLAVWSTAVFVFLAVFCTCVGHAVNI